MSKPAVAPLPSPAIVAPAPPPPPLPPKPVGPYIRQTVMTPGGWRWALDRDESDPNVRAVVYDKAKEHGAERVAPILGVSQPTLNAFIAERPVMDLTLYSIQQRVNALEELDRRADVRKRLAAQADAAAAEG
jgi:hypothetical protein